MSDIAAQLEILLERLDGALAAALVAADGIPVASVGREHAAGEGEFDLDALTAELLTQVQAISDEQRDLDVGAVEQYAVSTDRYTILVGRLQAGYYLLLVLAQEASFGRARFELRRARLLFENDLG